MDKKLTEQLESITKELGGKISYLTSLNVTGETHKLVMIEYDHKNRKV